MTLTEKERERRARHRLAIIRHAQEVTRNVSKTCRYYGITRTAYYKWLRRYEAGGLEALKDGSSRPHSSPRATRAEVVGKIVYLRSTYHFGPHKIAMYLARYHDITISPSGIWRILKRLDMSRLPSSQRYKRHQKRWKRYEKPEPGLRVQVDVKFIAPLPGTRKKHYQFTAIDDCTRIRVLRVYDRANQRTAIRFVDEVLSEIALPGRGHPDRQRRRVPVLLPLPPARSGRRPRLHQAGDPAAQRQGGAFTPHRRGGVLPAARGRRHR
jgi:transposase